MLVMADGPEQRTMVRLDLTRGGQRPGTASMEFSRKWRWTLAGWMFAICCLCSVLAGIGASWRQFLTRQWDGPNGAFARPAAGLVRPGTRAPGSRQAGTGTPRTRVPLDKFEQDFQDLKRDYPELRGYVPKNKAVDPVAHCRIALETNGEPRPLGRFRPWRYPGAPVGMAIITDPKRKQRGRAAPAVLDRSHARQLRCA